MSASLRTLWVTGEQSGARLDRVLEQGLPEWTRSQLKGFITEGRVQVEGGVVTKAGARLRGGQRIQVQPPVPQPATAEPEDIPLDVRFEDEHVLVVSKPAGMVVHPARGNLCGTLVNAVLHRCPDLTGIGDERRPGIVHRLDKDTTGLMVVAKTQLAHRSLSAQIKARTVIRRYLAIALGSGVADAGTFDTPYGRHPTDRLRFSARGHHTRTAVTHFEVLARGTLSCLVAVQLQTGRTHQIRVHFAEHGHPLAADPLYGRPLAGYGPRRAPTEASALALLETQALHAAVLGFNHPTDGRLVLLLDPPPSPLRAVIARCYEDGELATSRFLAAVAEANSLR